MHKRLRTVAEFLAVAVCTVAFVLTAVGVIAYVLRPDSAGETDFVEYWVSAKLLVQHENPYAASQVLPLERSAGFPSAHPALIVGNPPWSLPLFVPLSVFGVNTAKIIWFLLSLVCLVVSVRMIWKMHGAPGGPWNVLGYTFAPALICLLSGQVTIFVMFGLVLFLRLHKDRPFLAGAALWFCMLKPHLFVPFGVALLLWVIFTRNYRVILGAVTALGAGCLIATGLDQNIWRQYAEMMLAARIDRIPIPCLSVVLRESMWPHNLVVQCFPVVLGCVWATYYFVKQGRRWNWLEHGALLVLVSVLVAPYTWLMDQVVVLPALLHAVYFTQRRALAGVLGLASAAIEIAALRHLPLMHSNFYLWTAPGWLAWYVFAKRSFDADMDKKAPDQAKSVSEPMAKSS